MMSSATMHDTQAADLADPIQQAMAQWMRERPDLDPTPMAVYGRIARIFTLQRKAQALIHERFGLTHAAFDVLANLRRSGAPHQKRATSLAESSMISTGGVTFRLDGLESAGLIRRVRDQNDRRVVYAELTDEGRTVIDKAIEAHLQMEHELLADLSPSELRSLIKLLSKIEASLAAHDASRID